MKKNLLLFILAWLTGFAFAGDLVKLNVKDPTLVKQYFKSNRINVNYSSDKFVIVTTTEQIVADSKLLKKNAWGAGENYFILWTNPESKTDYLAKIGQYIEILDQSDNYLIVQVNDENVTNLFPSVHGGLVKINNSVIRLADQKLGKLNSPREIDPFITNLMSQVQVSNIQSSVQHLQD